MKDVRMFKRILIGVFALILIYVGYRLIISSGNCIYGEFNSIEKACLYHKENPITGLNCLNGSETRTILGTICSWGEAKTPETEKAKTRSTMFQMDSLKSALQDYYLDNNTFPTTAQGLKALVKKTAIDPVPSNYNNDGYLKDHNIPKDSWGNNFIYESNGSSYSIISYGSDGVSGGSGYDSDIKLGSE